MTDSAGPRGHAPGGMPLAGIAGYLIRRSQRVHTTIWLEEFGPGITSPQYVVLVVLASLPGIDQRRLGEIVSLDKSSVGDVVARLESRLWIIRERAQVDGRRYVLRLAPAARIALSQLTPTAEVVQQRLMSHVSAERRTGFLSSLAAVARYENPSFTVREEDRALVLSLDAPGHLIRLAQQVHTSLFSEEFDGELTGPQFAVMHVLAQTPDLSQRELAERSALDPATARDIVLRLARRGWVSRRDDPADGRSRLLALTDVAQRAVETLAPRVGEVQRRLVEPLDPAARTDFLESLSLVAFGGTIPESAR